MTILMKTKRDKFPDNEAMSILQLASTCSTVICNFDNSLCCNVCQDVCIVCNDKIVGNVPYWPKQTQMFLLVITNDSYITVINICSTVAYARSI